MAFEMRLAGPLFGKELRVASRRRRYYLLRFAYVGLLMLVVVQLWYVTTHAGGTGSAVVQASRLGEAGKRIAATIVWFQFVATQVLAAVLLSDAITGEIRQRTLDALLVTPISGLHLVTGKMAGGLLQLVLLLSISLPALALVRIFGGVPWGYVVAGLCIAFSAAVFAGALSLFFSAVCRHAYEAVVGVLACYVLGAGMAGLAEGLAGFGLLPSVAARSIEVFSNPFLTLYVLTEGMLAARGGAALSLGWLFHCLFVLVASAGVLLLTVRRVRRTHLLSILARTDRSRRAAGARDTRIESFFRARRPAHRPIRRVKGCPVVWKELRTPLFRPRGRYLFGAGLLILVSCLVVTALVTGPLDFPFFLLAQLLQLLLVVRLAISAAGAFTREKEARTWPLLLATPLDDERIVKGKALGAFQRELPLLAALLLLYLLASLLGPMDETGFFLFAGIDLVGIVLFLLGVGLYLSTRLKTTTGAVASALALFFVPKLFCCGSLGPLFFLSTRAVGPAALRGLTGLLGILMLPSLVYMGAGLIGLRAATRRLRCDIF
jgi:ABC-type transport system involved in multi-copper enzyme maturation permease subunit